MDSKPTNNLPSAEDKPANTRFSQVNESPTSPLENRPKKILPVPILLTAGIVGVILVAVILVSSIFPRRTPSTISPTPPPERPNPSPTQVVTPTRKVSTNSAIQAIFDAESSISGTLNNADFNEQKLIPPQLDMSISF